MTDKPPEKLSVQGDEVFALHRRRMEKSRLPAFRGGEVNEQLRRLQSGARGNAGDHGQDGIVQSLVVSVALS